MALSVTYVFSPTTAIKSAEVNQNFTDVVDYVNNLFQTGVIFWFDGEIGEIPSSYYYCDGNNGTPDLRKKCVRGVGDGLSLRVTGGAETITLSVSQLPSHNHKCNPPSTSTSINGNHKHGAQSDGGTSNSNGSRFRKDDGYQNLNYTDYNGNHSHTIDIPEFTSGSTGSGQSVNVMNPYIALVPIMVK